jgi:hypothetical protein
MGITMNNPEQPVAEQSATDYGLLEATIIDTDTGPHSMNGLKRGHL